MKDKLLHFVTHPAFISFLIWFIVILLIPDIFSKYSVKIVDEVFCSNSVYYFADLDKDNESEKIIFDLGDTEQTKILIQKQDQVFEQFNIKHLPAAGKFYYSGDYNSDGFSECFVFTSNDDSIFLTVFDPLLSKEYIILNRFIDIQGKANQSGNKPNIKPISLIRNYQSNQLDFIFMITAGFSKEPRRVYRYIIDSDSLIKSPESGACIIGGQVIDINDDSIPEIILNQQSTGNTGFDKPYTDQYGWLMVLNMNMEFEFPPVRFMKYPSTINVVPLDFNGKIRLGVFNNYYGTDTIKSAFYLYDNHGNLLSRKTVDGFEHAYARTIANKNDGYSTFYFLKGLNGEIEKIDRDFSTIEKYKTQLLGSCLPFAIIDADMDGKDEYFYQGGEHESVLIIRNDFSYCITLPINIEPRITAVSQVLIKDNKPLVYLQLGKKGTFIRYSKNPVYILKYPLYLILYLATFLLILLIFRLQRYRINTKKETENQMVLLQMKAIKNQLDPHFTLNVLNSIGSLYATEKNREQADYIFGKYAKLIRDTVISSDKVIIPIAEEIEFVRNYIELEKFRCNDAFSYMIDIKHDTHLHKKIPRMLIHTFVENAIKHGLKDSNGTGMLNISICQRNSRYYIEIEDNNTGTITDYKHHTGTGKGLTIIRELTDLYFKLERIQIKYSLKDRYNSDNIIIGKIAQVVIPV